MYSSSVRKEIYSIQHLSYIIIYFKFLFHVDLNVTEASERVPGPRILGTLRSRTGARTTPDRKLFSHKKHAH